MDNGEVPANANDECPGTQSDSAGKSDACEGCPNQEACATAPKGPDPDYVVNVMRLANPTLPASTTTHVNILNPVDVENLTATHTSETISAANTTVRAKRKYKWLMGSDAIYEDEYNTRGPDGRLTPLLNIPPLHAGLGTGPDGDGYIAENYTDDDCARYLYEYFYEVGSKPFYDPETNALGDLDSSLWFLLPANFLPAIAKPELVCKGDKLFNVEKEMRAGIYHLAKRQLVDKTEDERVKWAVLRLEMYKAGWFENQPMTRRIALTADYFETFLSDSSKIKAYACTASKLCSFVPFLVEHSFRTYGVGYAGSNKSDFVVKADKAAKSAGMDGILSYLSSDILYGQAFRWIGVKRPWDVLMKQKDESTIPSVFRARINDGPAGQALITSSFAVIQSMISANWWDDFKEHGNYTDTMIVTVNSKIKADPCRYHMTSKAYECPPLTKTEVEEVEEAKRQAETVSPVLQAYCDTILARNSLGKIKSFRRHSDYNPEIYMRAKDLFKRSHRQRTDKFSKTWRANAPVVTKSLS